MNHASPIPYPDARPTSPPPAATPPLSADQRAQFDAIARIAHTEAALNILPEKAAVVFSRIGKRLRALGLPDAATYVALIEGPNGTQERENLISALTTNVTSFFRENHHFEHFANQILPTLERRARAGGRVRLWSAACSSGQEAYSLAMVILEKFPEATRYDLRILATDVDRQILTAARAGIYPADLAEQIAPARRKRFFNPAVGEHEIEAAPELKSLIAFNRLNLMSNWPMTGRFDAIFCRNVMIYFDQGTQKKLIDRFAGVCSPGAALYLGHSERIDPASTRDFQQVGQTTFTYLPNTEPGKSGPQQE